MVVGEYRVVFLLRLLLLISFRYRIDSGCVFHPPNLSNILLQISDTSEYEPLPLAEPPHLRQSHHAPGARLGDDLAEHAGGVEAGQLGKVHRRLRVTVAGYHAPGLGAEGEDVAGTDEVQGGRGGAERANGRVVNSNGLWEEENRFLLVFLFSFFGAGKGS